MPTLFRLLLVLGVVVAAGYGALYSVASLVKPRPRMIVEAVALPQSATELRTGRSAIDVLDRQAARLVRRRKHIGR